MYDDILRDPSWWRALPLDARRGAPAGTAEQRAAGARRLAAWHDGILIPCDSSATDGWRARGVTDEELTDVLGEPAEALARRLPAPPYLAAVADAWRRFGDPAAEPLRVAGDDAGGTHLGFAELARPLLVRAQTALRRRLATGAESPADHPLLAMGLDRVMSMVTRTAVLELNVARLEGRLTGDTPEARFASFLRDLGDPVRTLRLLAEYPVLARELVTYASNWVAVRAELADRLRADLPDLRRVFGLTATGLADLVDVRFGAGDSHDGGRSVAVLTFAGGDRLVYKPRSIVVERHFNALLAWLGARGLDHPPRTLTVLDRGGYGWVEHAAAAPCADGAAVERYFWRQGAFLAVFHVLCGTDLHLENLVAAGEHPVFVDLEATFQSAPRDADPLLAELLGAAPAVLRSSVVGTGLLPQRLIELDETGWRDAEISAIAGGDNQLSPNLVPTFVDIGRDAMRLRRERVPMPGADNLARLDGSTVDPRRHQASILAGFEATYRLIQRARGDLAAPDGPLAAFRGCTVRYVARSTQDYGTILSESFHPDVLRDSLDREFLIEAALRRGQRPAPAHPALIASEARQLAGQDIPCFRTTTDATHLADPHGVVVADFLERSGLDAVRTKLAALSPEDLRRQRWCVEASLVGLTVGGGEPGPASAGDPAPGPLPDAPIDRDLAVRAASLIGDQLLATAVWGTGGGAPHWLALTVVGDRYWTVGPTGISLYEGTSGIALFLAHLAAESGQERFRRPAEQLAAQLAAGLARYRDLARPHAALTIGGFGDAGGTAYALTRLAALWDAPELLDPVVEAVPALAARFEADRALDVIGGTAGTLLALVALHRTRPDERVLDAIRAAEDVLARRAVPVGDGLAWPTGIEPDARLVGFSHGASGFAYALAEAAAMTGSGRALELCAGGLRYERQHLSRDRGNWPDLRGITPDGTYLDLWCHGAAGIGLARAALAGRAGLEPVQAMIEEDLAIALDTVRRDLVPGGYAGLGNDCLCHGDLGLLDTLYAAGDPDLALLGGRVAAAVAARVLAGEVRPGVPSRIPTPGLMMGGAGIGYGLLRAAAPRRVPSVLTLAAPVPVPAG